MDTSSTDADDDAATADAAKPCSSFARIGDFVEIDVGGVTNRKYHQWLVMIFLVSVELSWIQPTLLSIWLFDE